MDKRLLFVAIVLAASVGVISIARSEWKPEYAQASPEVQQWYRNAPLTEEAQRRFPFKKCCDHADVVRTKFQVNKVDGRDEWFYEPLDAPGTLKRIPDDIIHWGVSAPGGQPTLFVYSGKETCFFPGDSGI
jgi:hypothetical protein